MGPVRVPMPAKAERARRPAAPLAAAQAEPAWKGGRPPARSLPLRDDGTPDYAGIDRLPQSKLLTYTIRKLLVAEVGKDTDPRPWTDFDAILTSVREVNDMEGTAADVTTRARRVFEGILPALGIGWVPPLWKRYVQPNVPAEAANFAFFLVFYNLFPWLMGPMEGADHVEVATPERLRQVLPFLPDTLKVPQSVKAERCRFLESSGCASVCVNSCKAPSQAWLKEDFGMDMHIQPNYDDFSCVWRFGVEAPPLYEDEAVLVPCFTNCKSDYRGLKADGIAGNDADSLEAIAQRASAAARADAAANVTPDGTAGSAESLRERISAVERGGKCWSVDDQRIRIRGAL